VQVMTMGHFGVMRRLFVVSGLVVLGGFAMVLGRVLVVVRGLHDVRECRDRASLSPGYGFAVNAKHLRDR
jgi:hypothetical protein